MSLRRQRDALEGTDPARSLKASVLNETVYDDRRPCLDIFREELLGIDCRVDDVERFRHHLKCQETFLTVAYTPKTVPISTWKHSVLVVQVVINIHTVITG